MFENIFSNQTSFANQTLKWFGADDPETFEKNLADPNLRSVLERCGWLDQEIEYKFNSHGFRSPEFDSTIPHVCAFGCSITLGMGIQAEQRFGDLLAQSLGVACYNFGVTGGSDSTSFRLIHTWLPKLNPKLVIWQSTYPQRFEIINNHKAEMLSVSAEGDQATQIRQEQMYKIWITNEENSQLLAIKNRLAIRALCQSLTIKLVEICHEDLLLPWPNPARDMMHPGTDINHAIFEKIRDNHGT